MSNNVWYLLFSFVSGLAISYIILFLYYQNEIGNIMRIHNAIHKAQSEQIDELCKIIGERGRS